MFTALQGAMTGGKNVELLRRAIDTGKSVEDVKALDADEKETVVNKIKRERESAEQLRVQSSKDMVLLDHHTSDDEIDVEHA